MEDILTGKTALQERQFESETVKACCQRRQFVKEDSFTV